MKHAEEFPCHVYVPRFDLRHISSAEKFLFF